MKNTKPMTPGEATALLFRGSGVGARVKLLFYSTPANMTEYDHLRAHVVNIHPDPEATLDDINAAFNALHSTRGLRVLEVRDATMSFGEIQDHRRLLHALVV